MAEKIQIILKDDVQSLGRSGEVVHVKPGYARNYLIPQGVAVIATKRNVARLEHEKKVIELRVAKVRKDAESVAARLSGVTVQIERQVGEGDRIFGSVTSRDIQEALAAQGHAVDRKQIQLTEPIRALGQFTIKIALDRGVTAEVKAWVVPKGTQDLGA